MLVAALALMLLAAAVGGSGLARPPGPASSSQPDARPPATSGGAVGSQAAAVPSFALMQMNVCLSGLADCIDYPAVVREAATIIRETGPHAVTFNEACRRDVARIARRTGYHLSFARVIYRGRPLPCVRPPARGLFGDAVLTEARVRQVQTRAFEAQRGLEERRWLCAVTRARSTVCTAHLGTRFSQHSSAINDAQCSEVRQVLRRRAATGRSVVFGGDVNRRRSCAPGGMWTRTDRSAAAHQAPGSQHVYATARTLRSPSVEVVPSAHSDHDVLVVRATRTSPSQDPRSRR